MYLSKLQDLVPFMPKNRKISKLEVIQHVIDYICDLQSALENHPAMEQFDAEGALASAVAAPLNRAVRRPLGPRPQPNTILRTSTSSLEHRNQMVSRNFRISINPLLSNVHNIMLLPRNAKIMHR